MSEENEEDIRDLLKRDTWENYDTAYNKVNENPETFCNELKLYLLHL